MDSIVERFVGLILERKGKRSQIKMRLRALTDDEKNILLEFVRLAGFTPDELVVGRAIGTIVGGVKLKEFLVNNVCPFKVVDKRRLTLYDATGFLDRAVWSVGAPKALCLRSREELVSYITSVVKDSMPFEPIKLSQEKDDYLICFTRCSNSFVKPSFFVKHPKENDKMSNFVIGAHLGCGGVMYWAPKEISCARCGRIVSVPAHVVTYGDLRSHLLSVMT